MNHDNKLYYGDNPKVLMVMGALLQKSMVRIGRLRPSAWRITLAVASVVLLLAGTAKSNEGEFRPELVSIYLKVAFAESNQLVKFSHVPNVTVFCAHPKCHFIFSYIVHYLANLFPIVEVSNENSGADIEVLFYPTIESARQSLNTYTPTIPVQTLSLRYDDCSMAQFRSGYEVKKVVIVVVSSDDHKAVSCALIEMLRGAGVHVRVKYPEYSRSIDDFDRYGATMTGIRALLMVHVSRLTHFGDDRGVTERELQGK